MILINQINNRNYNIRSVKSLSYAYLKNSNTGVSTEPQVPPITEEEPIIIEEEEVPL